MEMGLLFLIVQAQGLNGGVLSELHWESCPRFPYLTLNCIYDFMACSSLRRVIELVESHTTFDAITWGY